METSNDKNNRDFMMPEKMLNLLPGILEGSDVANMLVKVNGQIIWVNKEALRIFQSNESLTDKALQDVWEIAGFSAAGSIEGLLSEVLDSGGKHLDVVQNIGDSTNFYRTKFYPLDSANDLIVVQMTNLSEEVTVIHDEQEKRIKAEENDRLKTVFLANMSHEIRTPLNSIIGFSELLLDQEDVGAESQEYAQMIQTAGDLLLQLINDIIDISKIEAGQIKISKSEVDVASVLEDLLLTFENQKKRRAKDHVQLILEKPEANIKIQTDPHRFRQIFTNLLSNALKFSDEGSIRFGFTEIEQDFVQFFVKDTGTGIEAEKTHLIFQRFAKFDSPQGHNKEGTGLGLSITKQLVELLGGKIWFDTAYQKGSTFYFTLPLAKPDQSNLIKGKTKALGKMPDWSEEVFLVVDDVEANFLFYRSMLKHTYVKLIWAKDGRDAIAHCVKDASISLVLMDVMMPHMDGYDTAIQIKAFRPSLPIIAQTAFADDFGKTKALAAGCDDYITKPIQQSELMTIIQMLLKSD